SEEGESGEEGEEGERSEEGEKSEEGESGKEGEEGKRSEEGQRSEEGESGEEGEESKRCEEGERREEGEEDLLSRTDVLIPVVLEEDPPLKQAAGIEELEKELELSVFFKANDYSVKLSNRLFSG
ncbi:PREDICTED: spore wall protein 2-like, partial [Leptosomus discolor]|uniref:spore wall protein 2-like n=1 Tax=Leptosomus discolor TaxID=188344 RepID=UPI000522602F